MKKALSFVLITLLILAFSTSTFAVTNFNMVLSADKTKVEKSGEVVVTLSLKNFTQGETGINTFFAVLDYDKAVFQTLASTDLTSASGWGGATFNPATGELIMDSSTFKAEDHEILKIRFKVKDNANVGNTTITVKNAEASDASNEITPSDQKITLTIQEKAAAPAPQNTVVKNTVHTNTATTNPTTGIEDFTVPAILAISVLAIVAYVRYTRLEK